MFAIEDAEDIPKRFVVCCVCLVVPVGFGTQGGPLRLHTTNTRKQDIEEREDDAESKISKLTGI